MKLTLYFFLGLIIAQANQVYIPLWIWIVSIFILGLTLLAFHSEVVKEVAKKRSKAE
jgi:hypothetical protein